MKELFAMVPMILIFLLNNILAEGMLHTKMDVDSNKCLASNCEESTQISYLNISVSNLEVQVVDQQKIISSLQGQLTNLNTIIGRLVDEVSNVNSKVDGLTGRVDVLEKYPLVEKIYTNESSVTIPAGKCSWVQVNVDVTGFPNDAYGTKWLYAILYQDGSPVYGGSTNCWWNNFAATGFTSTKGGSTGGTTSRIFSLPVKTNGTVLELEQSMGGYHSKSATRMTVLCFSATKAIGRM